MDQKLLSFALPDNGLASAATTGVLRRYSRAGREPALGVGSLEGAFEILKRHAGTIIEA